MSLGKGLPKSLGTRDVYALAVGATLSSGFFLLPGLAANEVGPAVPLAYALAGLVLAPGLLSVAELTTAMPKAGGVYYFADRAMGPLVGTIAGFGIWISLMLKAAFALVGISAYLGIFFDDLPATPIAWALAIVFGAVNALGARITGRFQAILIVGLLPLLALFIGAGSFQVDPGGFAGIGRNLDSGLVATAGLVIVSYMGLSNVASVAEEVRDPARSFPTGIFLAFGTVLLVYIGGTTVMVGVVGADRLAADGGDLTPVATTAEVLATGWGSTLGPTLAAVAALLAFFAVANAGILYSSRYPLAMARDGILPPLFGRISRQGTPTVGIVVTVALVIAFVSLGPSNIAKLASAFLLLTFSLACLGVIVMRESGLASYDPGFRSPLYPALHIGGILASGWMIVTLGTLPSLFAGGLVVLGASWYSYYAQHRVDRGGAILHVFERLGRKRHTGLDRELREIMKEHSASEADPFFALVTKAPVLDYARPVAFAELAELASRRLAELIAPGAGSETADAASLNAAFMEGRRSGATPVSHGVALPHLTLDSIDRPYLAIARAPRVTDIARSEATPPPPTAPPKAEPVRAVFFLVSPKSAPGRHLRTLAHIARRADHVEFMDAWVAAEGNDQLRTTLLQDELVAQLNVDDAGLVNRTLGEIAFPPRTLPTMVVRGEELIIPDSKTLLRAGDRLTVIGSEEGITAVRRRYQPDMRK